MDRSIDMVVIGEISLVVQLLDEALTCVESLQGVGKKVEVLKDNLKMVQLFLTKDINYIYKEEVSGSTSELRKVVHDAEDMVEKLLVNAESEGSSRRRRWGLFKSITKRDKTGEEIDDIKVRLLDICKEHGIVGGRDRKTKISEEMEEHFYWREFHLWETGVQVVGMEDDLKRLLRESILNEEKKGVSIAVVEGMSGIGKTTLARQIYNHPDVVAKFECRAWVWVSSDQFSVERMMKQLILQLPASDTQKLWDLELESEESAKGKPYALQKLQQMLHKQLQGQTYFIVLDDVWETMEHCEYLRAAFPDDQDKTSRLLVTTRNKPSEVFRPYTHHEMKLLDLEKSMELHWLKKWSILNYNSVESETIDRNMLEGCGGLPLAIGLVGGLLVKTMNKSESEHVGSQTLIKRDKNSIFIVSELSYLNYLNLSPPLKSCFLCLAFFREEATIPAKRLLNIWVVQGLIPLDLDGIKTTTEIARYYLDELIFRCMLQTVDFTTDGRVKNCYLHDVLRRLCLERAEEELVLGRVDDEKARHRVVYGGDLKTLSSNPGTHLRSLFLHNNEGGNADVSSVSSDFWKSCQLLKILHLDGIKLSTFPDSLRALVRLKYLMIRRHPNSCPLDHLEAVKLPTWLDGLKHLEILDMEGEKVEFPNDVALKMKRLHYFSAYCVRGPISITSWENIETLKYMRQEDWIKCCSRQSSSCNVSKLGLFLDPLSKPDEWRKVRVSLESLKKLEHLQLRWNRFIPVDPQIVPPLPTLTKLKLRGKLSKCPDAWRLPPNLTHLKLEFSGLREESVAQLRISRTYLVVSLKSSTR